MHDVLGLSPTLFTMVQVVNRDLSIAVLRQFVRIRGEEVASGQLKVRGFRNGAPKCLDPEILAEKNASDPLRVRVLEGLAASGLRAIRYALEVSHRHVSTALAW